MERLEETIYKKLIEKMDFSEKELAGFTYDSPLFASDHSENRSMGLDSIDALELIALLHDSWGVDVPAEDMEKLSTVNGIAEYIRIHKNGQLF